MDSLEWFASTADLANAMRFFHDSAQQPGFEPVADILSINPGVELDPKIWSYIGYKGGSEPGVFCMNWLLQRADGRWFAVSGVLNDTALLIEENTAALTFAGIADLLADQP